MNQRIYTLEEISSALTHLRSTAKSKRRFPKELWASIVHWAEVQSIEEICERFKIHPTYLKEKVRKSKQNSLDFQEVSCRSQSFHQDQDMVVIELSSDEGIRARIEGSASCLNYLVSLFRR